MSLSSDVNALAQAIGVRIKALVADVANKQPLDDDLTSIAGLASAANKMLYATGAGVWALADLSAFARTVLDDTSASAARATLDVYSKAESSALVVPVALMGSAKVLATQTIPATATSAGTAGYIPGLTVTITGDGRPVKIDVFVPSVRRGTSTRTTGYVYLNLNDSSVSLVPIKNLVTTDPGEPASLTYLSAALTAGVQYRFNVGTYAPSNDGTLVVVAASTIPAEIIATRA